MRLRKLNVALNIIACKLYGVVFWFITYVAHLHLICTRLKICQCVESVHVACDARVQFLNHDCSSGQNLTVGIGDTSGDGSHFGQCNIILNVVAIHRHNGC